MHNYEPTQEEAEDRKIEIHLTVTETFARTVPRDVQKEFLGEDAVRSIRRLLRKDDDG